MGDMAGTALDSFSPATRSWFTGAFSAPTAAQEGAWQAIGEGSDVLVVAPTGSGKTLAAFLAALDRLASVATARRREEALPGAVRVSAQGPGGRRGAQSAQPAHRNPAGVGTARTARAGDAGRHPLRRHSGRRAPLAGDQTAGHPDHHTRVAVPDAHVVGPRRAGRGRDGDPGRGARRRGDEARRASRLVAGAPRRAAAAPARRIGLSATVRPVDEVARYLSPQRRVEIVQPPSGKEFDLSVVVPVEDLGELGGSPASDTETSGEKPSIWPHVEERIADLVQAHRSTIVFANSRRLAERLCNRLNEIAYERATGEPMPEAHSPAEIMAAVGRRAGRPGRCSPARTTARSPRSSAPRSRRTSRRAGCRPSSPPPAWSWASTWARWIWSSRSSHRRRSPPACSASAARDTRWARSPPASSSPSTGAIWCRPPWSPSGCAAARSRPCGSPPIRWTCWPSSSSRWSRWTPGRSTICWRWCAAPRRSPRCRSPRSPPCSTCSPGAIPPTPSPSCAPAWCGTACRVRSRAARARSASPSPPGGTIPDRGLFGVFLAGLRTPGKKGGGRVGELDEEMVYESRVGDVFTLGTTSWRIEDITRDRVLVSPAPGVPGPAPVLEGRPAGPPARAGPRGGRVPAGGRRPVRRRTPGCGCWPPGSTPGRPTMCCRIWTSSAAPAAMSPTTGRSSSSGSGTSWATGGSSSTPRSAPRCTPRGRWRSAPGSPSGTAWTRRSCTPTTASCCGCPTPI